MRRTPADGSRSADVEMAAGSPIIPPGRWGRVPTHANATEEAGGLPPMLGPHRMQGAEGVQGALAGPPARAARPLSNSALEGVGTPLAQAQAALAAVDGPASNKPSRSAAGGSRYLPDRDKFLGRGDGANIGSGAVDDDSEADSDKILAAKMRKHMVSEKMRRKAGELGGSQTICGTNLRGRAGGDAARQAKAEQLLSSLFHSQQSLHCKAANPYLPWETLELGQRWSLLNFRDPVVEAEFVRFYMINRSRSVVPYVLFAAYLVGSLTRNDPVRASDLGILALTLFMVGVVLFVNFAKAKVTTYQGICANCRLHEWCISIYIGCVAGLGTMCDAWDGQDKYTIQPHVIWIFAFITFAVFSGPRFVFAGPLTLLLTAAMLASLFIAEHATDEGIYLRATVLGCLSLWAIPLGLAQEYKARKDFVSCVDALATITTV